METTEVVIGITNMGIQNESLCLGFHFFEHSFISRKSRNNNMDIFKAFGVV